MGTDEGKADENGIAPFDVNTSIIKGGLSDILFDRRKPLDDRVTGQAYWFRIEALEGSEVIAVDRMAAQGEFKGAQFSIKVIDIEPPRHWAPQRQKRDLSSP